VILTGGIVKVYRKWFLEIGFFGAKFWFFRMKIGLLKLANVRKEKKILGIF